VSLKREGRQWLMGLMPGPVLFSPTKGVDVVLLLSIVSAHVYATCCCTLLEACEREKEEQR
jgi:hypothetical protein